MKHHYLFLRLLPVFFFFATAQAQMNVRSYCVEVTATVETNPPKVILRWPPVADAFSQQVLRKKLGAARWEAGAARPAGPDSTYTDTKVALGDVYEYWVLRVAPNDKGERYNAYGYVTASVAAQATEDRGAVLVVTAAGLRDSLGPEIERLEADLWGDGWRVLPLEVSPDDTPEAVRTQLQTAYFGEEGVTAALLLGRVPIPYSGRLNPDGHPDHLGAWPADSYYADLDGIWTDNVVNDDTSASRAQNHNVPDDGKFDPSQLPSPAEIMVGRIDLRNLPAFELSETELLRRYLDKDHRYRHGLELTAARALIDDNFGLYGMAGNAPFAATAWRNFPGLVGRDSIFDNHDYLTDGSTRSYLWGFGCGGGSYSSAGGIGTTTDLAATPPKIVFNALFGSYFGDWDVINSFLRAPLGAPTHTLISLWSGRPVWPLHTMAAGRPVGECVRMAMNNGGDIYDAGAYPRGIHIALMGDPTLRLHVTPPPSSLMCNPAADSSHIQLTWWASTDPTVKGYHVYRYSPKDNKYIRLNPALLTELSFADTQAPTGTLAYMVRALRTERAFAGVYDNLSQGDFDTVVFVAKTTSASRPNAGFTMEVYPNPAREELNVAFTGYVRATYASLELVDMNGKVVLSSPVTGVRQTLAVGSLATGTYIVRLRLDDRAYQQKVFIAPH